VVEHDSVPGVRRNRPPRDTPGGGLPQSLRRKPPRSGIRLPREVPARGGNAGAEGRGAVRNRRIRRMCPECGYPRAMIYTHTMQEAPPVQRDVRNSSRHLGFTAVDRVTPAEQHPKPRPGRRR
jgi:hypothetical protein